MPPNAACQHPASGSSHTSPILCGPHQSSSPRQWSPFGSPVGVSRIACHKAFSSGFMTAPTPEVLTTPPTLRQQEHRQQRNLQGLASSFLLLISPRDGPVKSRRRLGSVLFPWLREKWVDFDAVASPAKLLHARRAPFRERQIPRIGSRFR